MFKSNVIVKHCSANAIKVWSLSRGANLCLYLIFLFHGKIAPRVPGPPHYRSITMTDTPHSVESLWRRDQPDAETRDGHPCPGWIRTPSPSQRAAADRRLKRSAYIISRVISYIVHVFTQLWNIMFYKIHRIQIIKYTKQNHKIVAYYYFSKLL